MISRRNIRVKVMQTLYSLEAYDLPKPKTEEEANDGKTDKDKINHDKLALSQKLLVQHLEQADQIFIYLLFNLCEVTRYADKDARQRASKYLPSEEDLHVNTKIVNNPFMLRLMQNQAFISRVSAAHLKELVDPEITKKFYNLLAGSSQYQEYINDSGQRQGADKRIIQYLFNELLMKDEAFDQHTEDIFIHWQDDKEMARILTANYLNKPQVFNFHQLISPEKRAYAKELIQTVLEKKLYCLKWIRPRLQNWDPDRVAAIDMILLFMGVCEFLYFPTIPTKVTINEYIDLAKVYSTPQSGQFVNGILDNVLKDLQTSQKIHKTERAKK